MTTDRTADRPHHLCQAYSCPLLGVMSESTRGGDEWLCFAHFGRTQWRDEITSHLHRMEWLTEAVVDLRTRRGDEHRKAVERIRHDLAGNRPLLAEFNKTGFVALEIEIEKQLLEAIQKKQVQQSLPA
jgi:hypothetical protein